MSEYYTLASLLSFGGAIAAIALIPAVIVFLLPQAEPFTRWIAFVIALFLAYLGAFVAPGDWTRWIVAAFNAFVLFAAALGVNQISTPIGDRFTTRSYDRGGLVRESFWHRWK